MPKQPDPLTSFIQRGMAALDDIIAAWTQSAPNIGSNRPAL
jgi:hypothetical protein